MRPTIRWKTLTAVSIIVTAVGLLDMPLLASVCNLKVVTDSSPDYHDMGSMIRSITSKWEEPEEKCWALFYWNHIARRQTSTKVCGTCTITACRLSIRCVAARPFGVMPQEAGKRGEVIFKIQGANVMTSMSIRALFVKATEGDLNSISVSTTNGLAWTTVWANKQPGESAVDLELVDEVNGAYEVLIRAALMGSRKPEDACLRAIDFKTITMLNSKTQPELLLGKNTIYVGAGDQTDSIVIWPDLQAERYKSYIVEERNITSKTKHPGYQGVMYAKRPNEDAYVVFRIDAPRNIERISYGGRFYNRAPKSRIDMLHSFDNGVTWHKIYSLTKTEPPWDVIHYKTVEDVPKGTRSVLFKYLLNSSEAGTNACSIYSVRMEVNYKAQSKGFKPVEVTFNWSEVQVLDEIRYTPFGLRIALPDEGLVTYTRLRTGRRS